LNYTAGAIKNTEFFTTAELAKKLKMNVQVVTRKIQSGEIMAYKIGKEWRVPEQSVFNWLQQHTNTNMTTGSVRKKRPGSEQRYQPQDTISRGKGNGTNRKYLLEYILAQFEPDRAYSEDDVNRIIARYDSDFKAICREFVNERMLERIEGKYRRRSGYSLSGS